MTATSTEISIERDERAPATARRAVHGWIAPRVAERTRADIELAVSELVTNAVRYAPGTRPVRVFASDDGQRLRVEVRDDGTAWALDRSAAVSPGPAALHQTGADGGFGLAIVAKVADRWGVDASAGTRVWCEIDLAGPD